LNHRGAQFDGTGFTARHFQGPPGRGFVAQAGEQTDQGGVLRICVQSGGKLSAQVVGELVQLANRVGLRLFLEAKHQ
jgi:hypothetical protein